MNIINEKIVTVLKEKKLKQKDLCQSINIPASTLNTWLKQGRSIPAEYLIPICEFLNISVAWLLTGKGEMYKSNTDIQYKTFSENELTTDEEIILEAYKELDSNGKKEALKFMILETEKQKIPKGKLYTSMNISRDEALTTHELRKAI